MDRKLIGSCVISRSGETLQAIEEAIKDNNHGRLESLLRQGLVTTDDLDRRHLLHQAAWQGYTRCVTLLLQHGVDPCKSHKKNGCTPLHNAHFCTIDDTDPSPTIEALVAAGASVNSAGGTKCGKLPVDHAIQHQRLDAVQALLKAGSMVSLQTLLIAIDVANPVILDTLLVAGGQCGAMLESTHYWSQPLHRVLYTPLKCPRESYKNMFRLLLEATVCEPLANLLQNMADSVSGPLISSVTSSSATDQPVAKAPSDSTHLSSSSALSASPSDQSQATPAADASANQTAPTDLGGARLTGGGVANGSKRALPIQHWLYIETELRSLLKDNAYLATCLAAFLVRNGFRPTDSIKQVLSAAGSTDWIDEYTRTAAPLRDLCVKTLRSVLYTHGNILYGTTLLVNSPQRVKDIILLKNIV